MDARRGGARQDHPHYGPLDADPLQTPTQQLSEMTVMETVMGGESIYAAEEKQP